MFDSVLYNELDIMEWIKEVLEVSFNSKGVHEAQMYVENSKDRYPKNSIMRFRERKVYTRYGFININIPVLRYGNKGFTLSFLPKYSRYLVSELNWLIKIMLTGNNTFRDIERITGLPIPKGLKERINKRLRNSLEERRNKEHAYPILKLDSTSDGKKYHKKSLYVLWGISHTGETKCLYHHTEKGPETGTGWSNVLKWMKTHVDLNKVQAVVSDQFSGLKKKLEKMNLPLQNCIFHRLESLFNRVKVDKKVMTRNDLLQDFYHRLFNSESKEESEKILCEFYDFKLTIRNDRGKISDRKHDKMLGRDWEDNFTYLKFQGEERKRVFQIMDIETKHSMIKKFLKKSVCSRSPEKLDLLIEKFVYCYGLAA